MRPTALTAIALTCVSGVLGIVATLRALIVAWYAIGYGFSFNPLRFCHSIFNLVALGAVTVALFAGAVLLERRNPRGRVVVIAASATVIVLSLIELGVWAMSSGQSMLGVHRWVWFALAIATLIVAPFVSSESRCTAGGPEVATPQPSRWANLLVAALAVAMAAYQLWLVTRQFDDSLHYVSNLTDLLPTSPSATWALAMVEPPIAAAVAALTLILGAVLISFGATAGRYAVIAGCILTVTQGIFGWTDLDRLFFEIGATDLTPIFAPRSASVVVLTLTVPVVTAVLAAAAPRPSRT